MSKERKCFSNKSSNSRYVQQKTSECLKDQHVPKSIL